MPHEAKENLLFFSIDKTLRMVLPFTYVSVNYSKYKTEGDKIEIYQYKILHFLFGTFENVFFYGQTVVHVY